MSVNSVFNKKTICLIVGASRGLGKTIAIEFSKKFQNSMFILLSRNLKELEETKSSMQLNTNSAHIDTLDLSTVHTNDIEILLKKILQGVDIQSHEQALIVHNASTLGRIDSHVDQREDIDEMQDYWRLNVSAPLAINNVFFRLTNSVGATASRKPVKNGGESPATSTAFVLNISSLCALKPYKSWAYYTTGKAMREMLFNTLCLENSKYRVLNYAPGALRTAMQVEARTLTHDPELKGLFQGLHAENKLIETSETVRKLLHVMTENSFDSGAHIDYFELDL